MFCEFNSSFSISSGLILIGNKISV
jgi:hypothetical protein